MAISETEIFQDRLRSNWVRLRTLVILRWIAITGQIAAIAVGIAVFRLEIEIGYAAMAIGVSVIANLFFAFVYPVNKRLSEHEASLMLGFDLLQLGALLGLTGGLHNPFAVLILAPVTIAATVLHLRSTLLLGLVAILLVTALSQFYLPLDSAEGELRLPMFFLFGFWVSLIIGVVFLGVYARQITTETHRMSDALLATQMALSREQKLTDLGGVVAAAAHELGTPLATIKLISSELRDELTERPDLLADVALISQQTDRCRDILRSMGRAGKDDLLLRRAPLEAIVQEAAEPHLNRGKNVRFTLQPPAGKGAAQPVFDRRPEIIHGLRNLIQNAVDFAQTEVEIRLTWTETSVALRITDDGAGFPASVIGRLGDPFVRDRSASDSRDARPGYEGMGLGLFIAKTLLERAGAQLTFSTRSGRPGKSAGGATVTVEWIRNMIDLGTDGHGGPLGDNPAIIS
jgi:two-component system sensor histidine kinase RegB